MRACKQVPPLNIDSANFSRKLGLYSKNAEHTAQFLACGVEDYQLEGFLLPPDSDWSNPAQKNNIG